VGSQQCPEEVKCWVVWRDEGNVLQGLAAMPCGNKPAAGLGLSQQLTTKR